MVSRIDCGAVALFCHMTAAFLRSGHGHPASCGSW
jgi:hypothetical protein